MLHTLRYARSMKMQVKYKTVVAPTKMQTSAFLKYQLKQMEGVIYITFLRVIGILDSSDFVVID